MKTVAKKPSKALPVVKMTPAFELVQTLGPYKNCGDANHVRTHKYFKLTLMINGKPLKCLMEIQKREDGRGRKMKGYSKDWTADITVNSDVGEPHDSALCCPECSGNWGEQTRPTSGDTAVACAAVVFPALESLGFKISTEYGFYKGWSGFRMLCKRLGKTVDGHKGRLITWTTPAECPVHGEYKHVSAERGDID